MNTKRTTSVAILMLGLLAVGCAQSTADVSKDDAIYETSMHLVFQPDFADRSFNSSADYTLSTQFNGVTYVWPEGEGNFSKKSNEISFEGKNITCSIVERRLMINGRRIAEFEEGDRVRITGDGEIFVNGVKLEPSDNM